MVNRTTPRARGCGSRKDGGLYLCVGLSPNGRPIEEFIIDPCHVWTGDPFRAPILIERKDGIKDVAIWIGAEFYFSVADFIEEARVLGISRRIPANFDTSQLTPGKSRMVLIHQRAIPKFEFEVDTPMRPKGYCRPGETKTMCQKPDKAHLCTFSDWPLGTLLPQNEHRQLEYLEGNGVTVKLPSVSYLTTVPYRPLAGEPQPYQAGAFAAFWLTHLEFVAQSKKSRASEVPNRVKRTGWDCEVMDE